MQAQPRIHTATAVNNTIRSIEDVVACMLAGANTQEARAAAKSVLVLGRGEAVVVGTRECAALSLAALANGTAAHALDYDDTFMVGANHSSAVLVPALLALAAEQDYDGAQLVDAYIVGLQIFYFLAVGCMRSHGDSGWHSTSTIGTIGAAGACARLMQLPLRQTAAALSLGTSMAAGMKVQFGSGAKPLHAGLAAQHGVQAAVLARNGLEGSVHALDGPMGFLELSGGPRAPGWGSIDKHLSDPALAIETQGLMIKQYPCCAATHRSLDCALGLQAEHGFVSDEVASVDTYIGYGHARNLMYANPQDHIQARFSMQYCMATALRNGELGLKDFTAEAFCRPDVQALMASVNVHAYPPETSSQPHRVIIKLKDGRRFEGEREHAVGTIHFPLSAIQRKRKFDDCASELPADRRDSLWTVLQQLDKASSCRELLRLLQA